MIKNYFKIAIRNLTGNKVYSFINIAGLAVGMAVAMLIGFWICDEIFYNRNFSNYDRIVRIKENSKHGDDVSTFNSIPIPLADELRTKYASDFKKVSLGSWNQSHILSAGEQKLNKRGMSVQPDFLSIFSPKILKGAADCLNDPSSIAISQSLATALFGNDNAINKLIKVDNTTSLKVTAVFEDFPYNSEFRSVTYLNTWQYYADANSWVKRSEANWDNNSFQLYAQLADNADEKQVAAKIKGGLEGHDRKDKPEVIMHPMSKWHLYTEFKNGVNTGGSIQFVWMFGIIGLFVLLLACINFMNLSTARSEKRAKEIGIRKAVGSLRKQLVFQFLSESLLISFLSCILAIILVQLSLGWFNDLSDKKMALPWASGTFWLVILCFSFFTGLLSGSYPAFYLSSFNAIKVLKGTFKAGRFASIPRKVLVVLQFSVSISLIIATIIVFRQIQFAKDRPVGYTREGLVEVDISTPELHGHYEALRSDLIHTGAVADMSESSSPATEVWSNQSGFEWKGKDPAFTPTFGTIWVTHDFGKTVGLQFKEGRDFSRDYITDSSGMVINEAAAKYMGLKDPVGELVRHEDGKDNFKTYKVIGVIHDMVMESPFAPVKPILYMIDYPSASVINIRINPSMSVKEAVAKIAPVFKKYNPEAPFDYRFADVEYAKKFNSEERIGKLSVFFAVFAVFISCLGLFGLASFTAEQRTKEIGIRKILGASVINVWSLLSKDFMKLVGISLLIAVPTANYFMSKWLENYTYRSNISWWIFFFAAVGAVVITLITVSYQAIKAAVANPVKSLRTE